MWKRLFGGSVDGGTPSGVPVRLDPASAYALWAAAYPPRPHNRLMEVEQAEMLTLLPDVIGKTVLDAGCGTGRYLRLLHDRGARTIGLDSSDAMLSRVPAGATTLVRGDFYALPFDEMSTDAVVCGLALGDVADLDKAIFEFARVLRPGGQLLYSVVHPDGAGAGWSRSFETREGRWEVAGHWHSRAHHEEALASADFAIDAWSEPAIDGQPVALVLRGVRGFKPSGLRWAANHGGTGL